MKWIKAPEGRITEHFNWNEAKCHCCGKIPNIDEVTKTAEWLEKVRAILKYPIKILSWCRCEKHNAYVGGKPHSYHLKGMAADIVCKEVAPNTLRELLKTYQGNGKLIGGMGAYPGFTHVDRGSARTWED